MTGCDVAGDRVPTRATLISIDIEDAPLRQLDGSRWDGDVGGGPELYVRLYDERDLPARDACAGSRDLINPRDDVSMRPRFSDTPWYDDVESGDFPLEWDVDGGFALPRLTDPLLVVLCDYDPTTVDDEVAITTTFALADRAPSQVDGVEDTILVEGAGPDRDRVLVRLRVVYR